MLGLSGTGSALASRWASKALSPGTSHQSEYHPGIDETHKNYWRQLMDEQDKALKGKLETFQSKTKLPDFEWGGIISEGFMSMGDVAGKMAKSLPDVTQEEIRQHIIALERSRGDLVKLTKPLSLAQTGWQVDLRNENPLVTRAGNPYTVTATETRGSKTWKIPSSYSGGG